MSSPPSVHHNNPESYGDNDNNINDNDAPRLKIKIRNMAIRTSANDSPPVPLRRSSRHHRESEPSGSEYQQSEKSMMDEEPEAEEEEEDGEPVKIKTKRGRLVPLRNYGESDDEEDGEGENDDLLHFKAEEGDASMRRTRRPKASVIKEDIREGLRRSMRSRNLRDFVVPDEGDEEDDDDEDEGRPRTRSRLTRNKPAARSRSRQVNGRTTNSVDRKPLTGRRTRAAKKEDDYNPGSSSPHSADADGSDDDNAPGTDDLDLEIEPPHEPGPEPEDEISGPDGGAGNGGKPYALRQRQKVNYAIPPPLEELPRPPPQRSNNMNNYRSYGRAGGGRGPGGGYHGGRRKGGLGWSASGAELGKWMGLPADDSDSDAPTRTPRKPFGGIGMAPGFEGAAAGSGLLSGDLAAAGTPSNLGKVDDSTLADADPLGVNVNVTFNEIGGLDEHINSLKEMTVLPLLYPEVFQQFNVTPPRGVLFHGPPGTGKTLLARALAASCRSNGKQITFFMRKGADALSKWVGEAERQLRLLFSQARSSAPSIIFFDEIDGLAPVRSSKQDQIHASIVSTLLALMDGMDGRGQVVVIGATNRPDAIDPALRRPGRFDREFYFPLPDLVAREKILSIMTKGWEGWGSGEEDLRVKERVKGLAELTKGYGGADLRALCTEAALNAIQRKYPQIYKSNDRLLLKPETISVGLRDFMVAIKRLVPSSARSSSSAAAPLPTQLVPLLSESLQKAKEILGRVLPLEKKLTALEEAEYEDYNHNDEGNRDDGDGKDYGGELEREMRLQSMEVLRIHRPRLVLHGPVGMGQSYIGAALLHHLEGYHVQSLELGTLLGDSARTTEAALVQLFVEAKRHSPSVIYIPSLVGWCAAISETARATVRAMLDTLAPTDSILLLAIIDGKFSSLPRDVRAWFGPTVIKDNSVELLAPSADQRLAFFEPLVEDIKRPPNKFADGMGAKRKKRVLEVLPIAPPLEPRKPTERELAVQEENDQRTITILKYRLGPIVGELKRKFKRFTKRAQEEYKAEWDLDGQVAAVPSAPEAPLTTVAQSQNIVQTIEIMSDGAMDVVQETVQQTESQSGPLVNGHPNSADAPSTISNTVDDIQLDPHLQFQPPTVQPPTALPQSHTLPQLPRSPSPAPQPKLYDMDLEKIHELLYKDRYLTPAEFLDDVRKIVHNAAMYSHRDPDRHYKAQAMLTATEVSMQDNFDLTLREECERMAGRERKRRLEWRLKRKEEKEKEKEKQKEKEKENVEAPPFLNGTRRSARNNGERPEMEITDPVALERRLKRQREGGDGAISGNVESGGEVDHYGTRDAKRSRIFEDLNEKDPLDLTTPIHTPPRPGAVRFAPAVGTMDSMIVPDHMNQSQNQPSLMFDRFQQRQQHGSMNMNMGYMEQPSSHLQPPFNNVSQQPIASGSDSNPYSRYHAFQQGSYNEPQDPSFPAQPSYQQQSASSAQSYPYSHSSHDFPSYNPTQQPSFPQQPFHHQQSSFQDAPFQPQPQYHHQQSSFQPQLPLNPQRPSSSSHPQPLPTDPPIYQASSSHPTPGPVPSITHEDSSMAVDQPQPQPSSTSTPRGSGMAMLLNPIHSGDEGERERTLSARPSPAPQQNPNFHHQSTSVPVRGDDGNPFLTVSVDSTSRRTPDFRNSTSPHPQPTSILKSPAPPEKAASPMPIIERTPTPLPNFHVSSLLLEQLHASLRASTSGLTVEELEQLRATCLGSVWRHRTEWDRDALVRELQDVVSDFVTEVGANANGSDLDDSS
ncbi:ATPase with bromodomain-containing protein [Lentinula aff. detonsa]|uniref:ATPase with bromodomain-containing protein n=1 Tax=Lentinula aff. detonsa TaxID=2804958 RepID=A0AA38NNX1_9AGAR|nr:ATPase with bromodomain-containing protein [Lentinula aff. detonsa]